MKAFVLPAIACPVERVMVEGCLRHFDHGEAVEQMLLLPNTISTDTINRVCKANCWRETEYPF